MSDTTNNPAEEEPDGPPSPSSPIVGQLRAALMMCQLCGALLAVLAVVLVVVAYRADDTELRNRALQVGISFMLLPGIVVYLTARSARRRFELRVPSARLWCILTGAFTMLAALPLISHISGALLMVVGLFTLTAALLLKRLEEA